MDISWKQVTNIPAAWNKPDLIEQRANFVNRRGLDIGRKLVVLDGAAFDLHSSQAFGYSPSGQPAVLSLVPEAKQVMLIGGLSVEGFKYFELLNANNTKFKEEPPNQAALVDQIKQRIEESITREKSQHLFSLCQQLYHPWAEFQEITGAVLMAPPNN
ncbi:hypothetical protein PSTG_00890 [Puccinia striiformis f. sp. tritici PST-78]|uniref:Uncharacterized protein n=1 Tax=Puccinia striiformis f. sp. tritici PST-78 TaxID=1165861 RepID=A0A0L0W307_9BASI|nr:hypothetical protein PSTG_00890 [Puccinia striiformis f. sp. tritici PST-78]